MPIASRLTNTGTLLVNGSFDEVTFNSSSPSIKNLAVYSQDTSSGTGRWSGYGRAANNQNYDYAPDGTFTAVRVLESADSVNALHGWGQSQTNYVAGNRYTISMYLKSYSADRNFMYGVSSTIIGGTASNYVYADCNPDTGVVGNALVYAPAAQTTSVTNVGNGWYRFSLSFLAANTATSGVDIQFRGGAGRTTQSYIGNGTSGVLFWGLQIEKSSSPTIYQGIAAAGTLVTPAFKTKNALDSIYSTGVFDEVTYNTTTPAIKNLITWSQNWTTDVQSNQHVTVTSNSIIAPDGTSTGSTLTTNLAGGTNDGLVQKWNPTGILTTALPYCFSLYVKQGNCPTLAVHLAFYNGTLYQALILTLTWSGLTISTAGSNSPGTSSYGIIDAGGGWYRLWGSITNNYSANGVVGRMWVRTSTTGNLVGDYNYVWGMQIEQGSSPTIYQATAASGTILDTGLSKREDSSGNLYVKNNFDEFTGAPVVDSSLKLWLDAGQTTSYSGTGTTWADISGSGYNLFGQAGGGSAPTFNSSPGTFSINNTTKLGFNTSTGSLPNLDTTTWSIEAWILHTSFNAGSHYNNMIANRENYQVSGFRFGVSTPLGLATDTTGRPRFWTDQSAGTIATGGSTWPITLNTWYQVTLTYTGTTCLTYINGALFNSSTGTYVAPTGRFLYIGTNANGCQSLNGQISAFKWYNRALTADEITTNFNALRNRYGI